MLLLCLSNEMAILNIHSSKHSKVGSPDPVRIERVADAPLSVVPVVSRQ